MTASSEPLADASSFKLPCRPAAAYPFPLYATYSFVLSTVVVVLGAVAVLEAEARLEGDVEDLLFVNAGSGLADPPGLLGGTSALKLVAVVPLSLSYSSVCLFDGAGALAPKEARAEGDTEDLRLVKAEIF